MKKKGGNDNENRNRNRKKKKRVIRVIHQQHQSPQK